jgi:pimeloyl-ACP methyl ester carboxylesterase
MPALALRTATCADVVAITELVEQAYAPWIPIYGRRPLPMTVDYAQAVADHRFDLHHRDGALAALIETQAHPEHLYIVNIAVAPALHGQGVGRSLLAHAETLAAQAGLAEMRLITNQKAARNIRIYAACGYRIDGEEVGATGVAVHMSKRLHPPLLFLPGAGASPDFWRPLADRLPADWPRRHLGWPGLGDQPAHPDVNSLDDLVRLVEARMGDGPADVLAQSMGGVVALKVALRNPGKVRRLVLSVTSGGVDAAARAGALHDWRETYQRNFPLAAAWIRADDTDLTRQLAGIACPVLLLFGDADPIAPPLVGERLAALLPNARLHVVTGGDHDLVVNRADEVAPLISKHLA